MTRRIGRIGRIVVVASLAAAALLPSCSLLHGSKPSYHVTAYFHEAIALYPHSKVKVMGMNIGSVKAVKVDGSRVRVDFDIDRSVPLPTDVNVTIQALTLIGERTVILSPAWKPGKPKIQDHLTDGRFVVPSAHTATPVEPDDGLKEFRDLAEAVNPDQLSSLVTNGAKAFEGKAPTFNKLLRSSASVTQSLASQDQQLIQTANNLHQLASTVNTRNQELGRVIDDFSQATGVLADQRDAISSLLSGANDLVGVGSSLLDAYKGQLPTDIARLTELGKVLQSNEKTFGSVFEAVPAVAEGLVKAYDPSTHQLRLGVSLAATLEAVIREPFCHGYTDFLSNLTNPMLHQLFASLVQGVC